MPDFDVGVRGRDRHRARRSPEQPQPEHAVRPVLAPLPGGSHHATALGLALLAPGCRWLKDWYFAGGGREGHTTLQGELPLDDAHARRSAAVLGAELDVFLAASNGTSTDRRHARAAIDLLRHVSPQGA